MGRINPQRTYLVIPIRCTLSPFAVDSMNVSDCHGQQHPSEFVPSKTVFLASFPRGGLTLPSSGFACRAHSFTSHLREVNNSSHQVKVGTEDFGSTTQVGPESPSKNVDGATSRKCSEDHPWG